MSRRYEVCCKEDDCDWGISMPAQDYQVAVNQAQSHANASGHELWVSSASDRTIRPKPNKAPPTRRYE